MHSVRPESSLPGMSSELPQAHGPARGFSSTRARRPAGPPTAAGPRRARTPRCRGPSPAPSWSSPPSRRTGGSRARRRSAAATRCSFPFHDLPLPRRDCRASLRSGPVAPLPRGAVARHALRCRPPLVVWRALTLVSRNEPLFVEFFVFFVDGVSCSTIRSKPSTEASSNCYGARTSGQSPTEASAASGLETLASKRLGCRGQARSEQHQRAG